MLNTPRSLRGMVTSPHHLASRAGLAVLQEGGTAVEAAVATAATLAVVYPHMTGIGGDGFWIVAEPGASPIAIDGCGAAGAAVTPALYRDRGLDAVPWRGPLAANTVAGTVSGWDAALRVSRRWGRSLPLSRILRDAVDHAERGVVVTAGQAELTHRKLPELAGVPGFAGAFLPGGAAPAEGSVLRFPALARSLRALAEDGLESFYRGPLGAAIARDLARVGSPLAAADLERHRAVSPPPLSCRLAAGELFNLPPPTQGLASLLILAIFEQLRVEEADGFDHVHGLVEATKQAFLVRDRIVGDPGHLAADPASFLRAGSVAELAARVDRRRALPWPAAPSAGDTVWLGAVDGEGRAVSMIQSVYFEFGSGVVLPETGIVWQNRGSSFGLEPRGPNQLAPFRKPFHTLNPALARLSDGRVMVYGTMGGEGQPQTQAAVFSRYALFGRALQEAVTAPRWLLGRTWGAETVSLKLERRFDPGLVRALREAGHDLELVEDFASLMGHAGAIVRHPDGVLEGAADPRSDGAVAAW